MVDFWVPERFAGPIKVGAPLTATPIADPSEPIPGTVSAVDNRIDEASRTLRVRAEIDNAEDLLRAGMSFEVDDEIPRRHLSGGQPAGRSSGARTAPSSGRSRTARPSACRCASSSATPRPCWSTRQIASGDLVVTEGVQSVSEGSEVTDRRPRERAAGRRRRLMTAPCSDSDDACQAGHMGFTALFIRRPVLAFVINALIVVAGLAAFFGVEVRELPDVDRAVVTVTTDFRRRGGRNGRPRTDRHDRRRGGPRLGRQVDLVELVLRPQPRHHRVQRRRRSRTSPPPTCATPSAASPTSCPTTSMRRASSRPTPMPTR